MTEDTQVVRTSKESAQNAKKELYSFADHYFNSVHNIFHKTAKQNKNEERIFALGFSFILISTAVIVISAILILDIDTNSRYIIIPILVPMLVYIPLITSILLKLEEKRKKGLLRGNKLAFCHLYKTISELKAYLTNERLENLEKAKSDFDCYLKNSEINFKLEVEEMRGTAAGTGAIIKIAKSVNVADILEEISTNFWWFNLNEKANLIANAYRQLSSKITRSLSE